MTTWRKILSWEVEPDTNSFDDAVQDPNTHNIYYFDFSHGLFYWTFPDGRLGSSITAANPSQVKVDLASNSVYFRHNSANVWQIWGGQDEMDAIIARYLDYLESQRS